jgi:protease-4
MALGPWGSLGELLAWPVKGAVGFVHRRATGPRAVLELEVEADGSTLEVQLRLATLRRACFDPGVCAVWLSLRGVPGGWATASDLRDVIFALRTAGKPVWAYVEAPGNALAWVASACDQVWLAPGGELQAFGVGLEVTLIGEALRRLGVEVEVEAAGAYKSAGEMFTRSHASPANLEVMTGLAQNLHALLVAGVAAGRSISEASVHEAIARMPLGPHEAVASGWVDKVGYEDEAREALLRLAGSGATWQPFGTWAARTRLLRWLAGRGVRSRVAVLHLEGQVVMDDSSSGPAIGARSVCEALRELREDDRIGAVVLHVDSPGGSALASDLIWREVVLLQSVKPVVASFGDVAASGGYYFAAAANEIYARANTLTGSIGVVGGKVMAREALRKLGVVVQSVDAAPHATMLSVSKPFSGEQRARFVASLTRVYEAFVERVAAGRGRSVEEVEPHCRGRVWLGVEALEVGLIDGIGDLHDAVARAAELAGIEPGPGTRVDLVAETEPMWRVLLRTAYGQRVPGALSAAQELVGEAAGPAVALLGLWQRHAGQPLALLPIVVHRDGR